MVMRCGKYEKVRKEKKRGYRDNMSEKDNPRYIREFGETFIVKRKEKYEYLE